ncbi:TniB family NTP-binding protein [Chromobacterium piscinae]|uniref:TniB family NTP-binding protein n=1 Tax=Chromobacterium piscinae TaxID=686831 RepID=UPI001E4C8118|nr:TniB family NTP-binding protein [Chromobacterium piscinae]MCD4504171.1 TniB family NTP-binding protein [Chromobacterium piscinae]
MFEKHDYDGIREQLKKIDQIRVKTPTFKFVLNNMIRCFNESRDRMEPLCMIVTGESGVGKSTLIRAILDLYKPTEHEEFTEKPIIVASIPLPSTIKALYSELLMELGAGFPERGSIEEKRIKLLELLRRCKTRLIILDEFQHLVERGTRQRIEAVADAIKTLINQSGIPIILVGVPSARSVLEYSPQLAGRFPLRAHIPPFDWLNRPQEFVKLLVHYDKALPFEMPSGLADDWNAARIYLATGGYFRLFTSLIREAARTVLMQDSPRIEMEHLAASFDTVLREARRLRGNPFRMDDREIEQWIGTMQEAKA